MVEFKQMRNGCFKCNYKKNLHEDVIKTGEGIYHILLCDECKKNFDEVKNNTKELLEWVLITDKIPTFIESVSGTKINDDDIIDVILERFLL